MGGGGKGWHGATWPGTNGWPVRVTRGGSSVWPGDAGRPVSVVEITRKPSTDAGLRPTGLLRLVGDVGATWFRKVAMRAAAERRTRRRPLPAALGMLSCGVAIGSCSGPREQDVDAGSKRVRPPDHGWPGRQGDNLR